MPFEQIYQPPPAGFASAEFSAPPPPDSIDRPSAVAARPRTQSKLPAGTRQPLALLALAVVAGGWWYRVRAATAHQDDHPLSARHVAFARLPDGSA